MLIDQFRHFEHAYLLLAIKDGFELDVRVDHALVLRVLQVILLDISPDLLGNLGPRERFVADDGT